MFGYWFWMPSVLKRLLDWFIPMKWNVFFVHLLAHIHPSLHSTQTTYLKISPIFFIHLSHNQYFRLKHKNNEKNERKKARF